MASVKEMFKGTSPQITAALAGTISAISDGMHYGWTAPAIPMLQSENTPIQITKTDENWLETIYLIGGIFGLPITILLVDRIGRKKSTILSSSTSLISWLLIAIGTNVSYLYLARFLSGLAADVAFVATPMYVAEIADQKIRGLLSSIIFLMMLFGILLIYAIAPFTPFYVPSIVGIVILLIQLVSFSFMPESPYYLLSKKKVDAARKSLNQLRAPKNNEIELEEITLAIERQRREKGRLLDLFVIKSNRKALLIVTILNAAQHFGAISVMLMNMHTILTKANSIYFSPNNAAILFSFLMFFAALVSSFFVDKYGRKVLLISSSVLTGICLLVLGIYFHLLYLNYDLNSVSWIPVAIVMAYAAVFKFGIGMVPIVVISELFPNKVKAMGMTIADGMYLVLGMISIEFYKQVSEKYGYHVPFYVFAIYCFFTTFFCTVFLPETKGKTLEEIQLLLKKENKPQIVIKEEKA